MDFEIESRSVDEVVSHINKFDERLRAGLLIITKQVAKLMENWAKDNAKWTDRTGNARKGLKASAKWEDYINLVVSMSHKVDYGPMLELAYAKKYAVLEPALQKYKNEFIRQWEEVIRKRIN